jgi:hypothetical protein
MAETLFMPINTYILSGKLNLTGSPGSSFIMKIQVISFKKLLGKHFMGEK